MTSGWLYEARYQCWTLPEVVVHVVVPDEGDLLTFARLALDAKLATRRDDTEKDVDKYTFRGVEKIARAYIDERVMAAA